MERIRRPSTGRRSAAKRRTVKRLPRSMGARIQRARLA
jgi:hypothetical protein